MGGGTSMLSPDFDWSQYDVDAQQAIENGPSKLFAFNFIAHAQ